MLNQNENNPIFSLCLKQVAKIFTPKGWKEIKHELVVGTHEILKMKKNGFTLTIGKQFCETTGKLIVQVLLLNLEEIDLPEEKLKELTATYDNTDSLRSPLKSILNNPIFFIDQRSKVVIGAN